MFRIHSRGIQDVTSENEPVFHQSGRLYSTLVDGCGYCVVADPLPPFIVMNPVFYSSCQLRSQHQAKGTQQGHVDETSLVEVRSGVIAANLDWEGRPIRLPGIAPGLLANSHAHTPALLRVPVRRH